MAGLSYVDPASILDDMPVEVRFMALKNAWANKMHTSSFKLHEDALFSLLDMHSTMHFAVNMKLVHFEPYSVLFRQDQGCLDFYLIIKGPAACYFASPFPCFMISF
jgi:hypothetical protein